MSKKLKDHVPGRADPRLALAPTGKEDQGPATGVGAPGRAGR